MSTADTASARRRSRPPAASSQASAGASSPRPPWTAARAPQANGESAKTSARTRAREARPRAAAGPAESTSTGSRLSAKPRPSATKSAASCRRRLRVSPCSTRPAACDAARKKASVESVAQRGQQGRQRTAGQRRRAMPSAIGISASTIGCSRFASSDEPREHRQRDREVHEARHVVGLGERDAGEQRREHPEDAEAGGHRREQRASVMPGPERTSAVTRAVGEEGARTRQQQQERQPQQHSRPPRSRARSERAQLQLPAQAGRARSVDPRQVLAPHVGGDQLQEDVLQASRRCPPRAARGSRRACPARRCGRGR